MSNDDIRLVQTCYPQIYLACHTRHRRAATSAHGLSANDSALLAHLDERRPTMPSTLARHLGVGRPTMSAAVKRLRGLGYIEVSADVSDARTVLLRLTRKGATAMRETSVLEPARVQRVLALLAPSDRRRALKGLWLLADAATRAMMKETRTRD